MKITKFISQNRRDFTAEFICEGCNEVAILSGYDDSYFHQSVIPDIKCKKCNESANSLKVEIRPLATRYSDNMIV